MVTTGASIVRGAMDSDLQVGIDSFMSSLIRSDDSGFFSIPLPGKHTHIIELEYIMNFAYTENTVNKL